MKTLLLSSLAIGVTIAACSAPPPNGLLGSDDPQNGGVDEGGTGPADYGSAGDGGASGGDAGRGGGGGTDGGSSPGDSGAGGGGTDVFSSEGAFTATTGPSGHHNPGRDCLSCHDGSGDAPNFVFAGTVYDGSGNAVAGAEIRVQDSAGKFVSVYSASNGNFYQAASGSFAAPGHAGARNATNTNLMSSNVTNGGCNSCHCTGGSCTTTPIHVP